MSRLIRDEGAKGQTKTTFGPIRWMVLIILYVVITYSNSNILFFQGPRKPER